MPTTSPKILDALGLGEDADEATLLSAINDLKAAPKSLEAQAADEGKVLLDKTEADELRAKATTADATLKRLEAIETERADEKFAAAYDKALSEGRVDAKDETRELHRQAFDLNQEVGLKLLASLPKVVNTTAQGASGHTADPASPEKIDGFEVDGDSARLLDRAEALMKEDTTLDFRAAVALAQEA